MKYSTTEDYSSRVSRGNRKKKKKEGRGQLSLDFITIRILLPVERQ